MGQRRSIGVAELAQRIADEAFPDDASSPIDRALLYRKCRRLAYIAPFGVAQAQELIALAHAARDERVKAIAKLACLAGAEEVSTDNGAWVSLNFH